MTTLPINTPPDAPPDAQTLGLDIAALLTFGLIAALYQVLALDLRNSSPTGLAFKADSLRVVITLIFGFLGVSLFIGEGDPRGNRSPLRIVAGIGLALYTAYVASFVFLKIELATDTALPAIMAIVAAISVLMLWQPWARVRLYARQRARLLPPLLVAVVVLIAWEALVRTLNIQQFLLPAPTAIAGIFATNYPRLVNQGWLTFQNALWGFVIGCGLGIAFGLLSARFSGFSRALLPYAIAVNAIPIIAFAPITNAWFGVVNPTSKIIIVAILTFFPTMINTVRGLTAAEPAALELMHALAATQFDTFRKVRLPAALPYIFNGLKISTSLSMIGAIVAEYFGGPTTGLGVQISSNAMLIRFPMVWSQIIIASLLGIIFYFVVSLAERLIMPWHLSFRPTTT